jgi:hypothetical protein
MAVNPLLVSYYQHVMTWVNHGVYAYENSDLRISDRRAVDSADHGSEPK